MDAAAYKAWIGRSETLSDVVAAAPIAGLAALLDYPSPPWLAGEAPPLSHWCNFVPQARQSDIDLDGHPKRGGFLPPIDLPRRMWAGSRLSFHAPIRIGDKVERCSTILDVTPKSGASGALVFLKLHHEISAGGTLAITEEQDIVYREAPKPGTSALAPAEPKIRASAFTRSVTPDPVQLFRYSALTFNGHRIHYDRDYAREEGYPGLVVHGPLIATLLMDHFLRHKPGARVTKFDIRLQAPLFDTAPFDLCLAETAECIDLWSAKAGQISASAKLQFV